jgi:hypothetical protein
MSTTTNRSRASSPIPVTAPTSPQRIDLRRFDATGVTTIEYEDDTGYSGTWGELTQAICATI